MELTFSIICKQSVVLSQEKYLAARNCTAHTLTPVCLFGLRRFWVIFKEMTKEKKNQNQRIQVPVHLLRSKGMLQAMKLKPERNIKYLT